MLDDLISMVKGGRADALVMNQTMRNAIQNLLRAAGQGGLESGRSEMGTWVQSYLGIPIIIDDWILNTHDCAAGDCGQIDTFTGGDSTIIAAVRWGEGALAGLQAPGGLTVVPVGELEKKDGTRTRVKWYTSLALFATVSCSVLIGVKK